MDYAHSSEAELQNSGCMSMTTYAALLRSIKHFQKPKTASWKMFEIDMKPGIEVHKKDPVNSP